MPQVTVYVRKEDLPTWESIRHKAEFLHNALQTMEGYKQLNPEEKKHLKDGLVEIAATAPPRKPLYGTIPADSFSSDIQMLPLACCLKTKPCQHWLWDGDASQYVNSRTGEVRSVDF